MKNAILLVGALLLSVSCVELNGRMNVQESLVVKKKHGFLNLKTSKVELQPASYQAGIKINSDRNITLSLEGGSLGKKILVPIKAEEDLNIPGDGKFAIAGEKINQPFDVVGSINTDISYSDVRFATESCTWTTRETRCEKVCTTEPRKCESICKEYTITHEGRKEVEFQYRYTRRDVQLELMQSGSTALKASLNASGTESDRITLRESSCHF